VLSKLHSTTEAIAGHLEAYRFSEAYDMLYHFVWDDVADWYIEASKNEQNGTVLAYVLENILRLAHPFAPFLTETIWQVIPWTGTSVLAVQDWPKPIHGREAPAADFEEVKAIVTEVRALIRDLGLRKPHLYYTDVPFLTANAELITRLTSLAAVQEVSDGTGLHLVNTSHRCWLDVDTAVAKNHLEQLGEQVKAQESRIKNLLARLENDNYVKHAPKEIVRETKTQLTEAQATLERLHTEYRRFSELR